MQFISEINNSYPRLYLYISYGSQQGLKNVFTVTSLALGSMDFLCDASEEFIDNTRFQYFSSSSQHFGLVFPSTIQRMDSRQTVKAKFQQIFLKATRMGFTGHGTSFKSFRKSLSSTSIFFFMNIYLHLSLTLEALCALHIIVHQLNYNPSFTVQFSHHSFCELSHMLLCPYLN